MAKTAIPQIDLTIYTVRKKTLIQEAKGTEANEKSIIFLMDTPRAKYKEVVQYALTQSCFAWAMIDELCGEGGQKLEFKNHAFLKDIFDDWTPIQTARKSAQIIGFSTMQILKSFWAMKNRGWNIVYLLPTFSDVSQFVPSKVNAIIQQNPRLVEWTKDKDTIFQKKIGDNFIYYRGTHSSKSEKEKSESGVGIMFSASLIIADEADRSDQFMLEQYDSRLEASDYKGKWYFSNPTHPNTLSQKLWEKSDQKHWFIQCEGCNEWQYLEWPDSIKEGKFVCKKCHKEITDDQRRQGRWVKKYQNRDISGYWLPHLIVPSITAKHIEEQAETKTKQYFYNFVLGLPYRGSDIVVDENLIARCVDYGIPNLLQENVIGVDVGMKKNYVLGNKQGIFKVGEVDSWGEIEELLRKYDVRRAVFDALPDLTEPRKLKEKYPGIVWLSFFKKEVRKADFVSWDSKTHTVYSDRSKIIQEVIDNFLDRKIRFQMKIEELKDYIKHWKALYKVKEKDIMGVERDIWESDGEDHFVFATIFFFLALGRSGETKIEDWQKPEKVVDNLVPDIQRIIRENEFRAGDWRT